MDLKEGNAMQSRPISRETKSIERAYNEFAKAMKDDKRARHYDLTYNEIDALYKLSGSGIDKLYDLIVYSYSYGFKRGQRFSKSRA